MSVIVRIPTPLRKLAGGNAEVEVQGSTISEVIDNLEKSYPGLKERICDEKGAIRRFVNIYVREEDIRFLKNMETEVKDGDVVSIVPAIAGGAIEKRRVYLTFPKELVKEPLIYRVGHKFEVVTNIRQASVSDEIGLVALELEGEREEIKKAIAYFQEQGVKVEPIEMDVIE
ncbi:MAG TPA: MoaD family protein [Candidatus Limnocylindrales bacterium]|nr:MoaD family protein [Candidatus Limnocylindrales bacterium]